MSLPFNKTTKNKKGFTLIEMLIVIALISVVSVALISWIDPMRQFEKGRNAAIEASMGKMLTAINGYYSVYGEFPTCEQLYDEIENEEGTSSNCALNGTVSEGTIRIAGLEYPDNCTTEGYAGGSNGCSVRYEYDSSGNVLCLGVMKFEKTNPYMLYHRSDVSMSDNTVGWEMVDPSTSVCDLNP